MGQSDDHMQSICLPNSLEANLMPGSLTFALDTMVDASMTMSIFDRRFHNGGRASKVLVKVILLAYCRGITSSRQIEAACRDNIAFMALARGYVPDHRSITAFVLSTKDELCSLFRDVLLACGQMNLLANTPFADGSNTSTAAHKRSESEVAMKKRGQELETKISRLIREHLEADAEERNT